MYLGIEIGGTKLQAAIGKPGKIEKLIRREVDPDLQADGIREQLSQIVPELCNQYPVQHIGVGFGGPVETKSGVVTTSHQVTGWDKFPLAKWLAEISGVECTVVNDCDAAALAEACWGAGQGASGVIYVTVGTGVGGGYVVDGVLQGTNRPASLELGHLRPGLDSRTPYETVESLSSGRGIETRMQQILQEREDDPELLELKLHLMGGDDRLTAKQICLAAAEGNPVAVEIMKTGCQALGWAIAQSITLLAPECVVIGGGVSLAGDKLFYDPVRKFIEMYVFPRLLDSYRIEPAALGEEVVLHGALQIAAHA
ncbi:MAG: ROK family protein [Planctomycetaceae bacterium]|nr:ROK family protein [Planctomycetaceae bacterium]